MIESDQRMDWFFVKTPNIEWKVTSTQETA